MLMFRQRRRSEYRDVAKKRLTTKGNTTIIASLVFLVIAGWFMAGFLSLSSDRANEVCGEKLDMEFPLGNAKLGPDYEISKETHATDGSWLIERTWFLDNPTWGLQKFSLTCKVTGNNHISQVAQFDLNRDVNLMNQ